MSSSLGRITGCLFSVVLTHILLVCHGQSNNTEANAGHYNNGEIDYEALSIFGVTPEFAQQFRLNLIKALEAAKDEVDPLRQGEFGGVSGGTFQQGGGAGNNQDEEEEEDEDPVATTPGPGAFGILSGLFGIFSGLGSFSPSRIIQSTVNFFPPGQRMQAQTIVDSLIGYTPPENRTTRPRPRTRRPSTTPMSITELMMKEAVLANATAGNQSGIISKDGESNSGINNGDVSGGSSNGTMVDSAAMSEVVAAAPEPTSTTPTLGLINVHEILDRSTSPHPPQNEDDEGDFEKKFYSTTERPKSNSSMAVYKLKVKAPTETDGIETRGVAEDNETTVVNSTTLTPSIPFSSTIPTSKI